MTLTPRRTQTRLLWLGVFFCLLNTTTIAADAQRGEYLTHAGGCSACHTQEDGPAMAGGRALESPFGTFYSPNITPHATAGIGTWSDAEFIAAFQEGLNPAGEHYYPAFPYPSYTGLSNADLLDIKAYLNSLPASTQANRQHDLVWYAQWRAPLYFWKWLYFNSERFAPEHDKAAAWNRGAYLVRHLGHCGECHTPRTILGGSRKHLELAGAAGFGEAKAAPNLTPHADGLQDWRGSDV